MNIYFAIAISLIANAALIIVIILSKMNHFGESMALRSEVRRRDDELREEKRRRESALRQLTAHRTLLNERYGVTANNTGWNEGWVIGGNWSTLSALVTELAQALDATLEYIDAIPDEVAAKFPAMPGIARSHVDEVLKFAKGAGRNGK